jgi:hypothetical protein
VIFLRNLRSNTQTGVPLSDDNRHRVSGKGLPIFGQFNRMHKTFAMPADERPWIVCGCR